MNRLIAWFTDNTIAANLIMISIMIGGISAIPHISKEFFPSTPINVVEIITPYPGAAPINVEEQVCIRIEQEIEDLEGIDKITSKAMQDLCDIQVEAEDNYDIETLLRDVKVRVDALTTLPVDAERPQVSQVNLTHDMMDIALEGDVPEKTLKRYAEKVRKEMEALPFVSTVKLQGLRDYEIAIELSSDKLIEYQLTFSEVKAAIQQASLDLPTGKIRSEQGDILLQTRSQAYDFQDFSSIIVRKAPDGTQVLLGDIATIKDAFAEDYVLSRFNGKPAVFLKVQVSSHPDVVKTSHSVSKYIDYANQALPGSMKLTVWHDFSDSFKGRIKTLITNGISGLILVYIVLMLFLRPMLALWVTIGIGISFLGTLWVMPFLDASLNMVSLFAFLLILGIVVDDAIIVGESVYNEQQKHGTGLATAKSGTQKVSKPIVFAVASTMLVFVPMLFLPGQSAKASMAIPTVVLLTLAFSLIESLFILPSHLADMPPEGHFKHPLIVKLDNIRHKFSNGMDWVIRKFYSKALEKALANYGITIAIFTVTMAMVLSIFAGGWMRYSFLPNVTTDYIRLEISLPDGEPFSLIEDITDRVELAAQKVQKDTLFAGSEISYIENYTVRNESYSIHAALGLNRDMKGKISSPEIIETWREAIGPIPEAESVDFFYTINSSGKPLQYILAGTNNDELHEASLMLQNYLLQFPGVFDAGDSLQTPRSEMELSLKDSSIFNAWSMQTLAEQIRSAFYGNEIQRVSRDGEDIRVMLRLSAEERKQHENILSLPVRDMEGQLTRLDAISDISYTPALQDIERIDGKRTVIVSADLISGTSDALEISDAVLSEFTEKLSATHPSVVVSLEGEEEARREFMSAWMLLFFQTVIAIYAMMAVAFRSYWQPIIILTAIPFGTMGAILGHLIMGREISVFSFLGLLACAGVVVNDNLVLIDRINQLRQEGIKKVKAIHQSGLDRFRPIILTSVTTFIGLIPIMSETSLQAQFLIPMVISLAFGVLFATAVTLLLVPCLYLMGEQWKESFTNLSHRAKVKNNVSHES